MDKKCKYCAMAIPEEAKLCPFCRKQQGFSRGFYICASVIVGIFILLAIGECSIDSDTKNNFSKSAPPKASISTKTFNSLTPEFKVIAKHTTVLSILVHRGATDEHIKALIYKFKETRLNNTMSKMISATTKGGAFGDYGIVWILIFSEPEWATQDKLQKFINSSAKNPSNREFDIEYANHIRGEYYYSFSKEYGTLGYDDGIVRSQLYQKLF